MGQYSTRYRHVFFDLDHTLWDHDANSQLTLASLFESMGIVHLTTSDFDYFFKRYSMHNERCWDLFRQDKISKSRLRSWRFELALNDLGIRDKPLARKLGEEYMEHGPKQSTLIPGAQRLLEELQPHYRMHILSNGFHDAQVTKLRYSGIEGYFDHVITSELASVKKPNMRIFEFAMQRTGANAEESIMVGDHLEIDVLGAAKAGWFAIHFNPARLEHNYPSVESLDELSALLLS